MKQDAPIRAPSASERGFRACNRKHRSNFASTVGGLCTLSLLLIVRCNDNQPVKSPPTQPVAAPVTKAAKDGPVEVTVYLDRDRIIAPETAALTVTVRSERGVTVKLPELKGALGGFLAGDPAATQPAGDVMSDVVEHRYQLEPVLPGEQEIPPLKIEYTDARERADGSHEPVTGMVETEPIPVHVDLSLADVRAAATLPIPWPMRLVLWTVGILVAMALLAFLARYFIRLRRRRLETAHIPPPIVAHEWALAELEKLIAEDLIGRGLIQEFYYRINALAKRYIELRFGLHAGEQTSEEFLRSLQSTSFLRDDHKRLLREFTAACDPVKYAAIVPDRTAIDWVTESARRFITETAARPGDNGQDTTVPSGPPSEITEQRSLAHASTMNETASQEAIR